MNKSELSYEIRKRQEYIRSLKEQLAFTNVNRKSHIEALITKHTIHLADLLREQDHQKVTNRYESAADLMGGE